MSKPGVTNKAKQCEKHGTDTIKINMGPWTVDKGFSGSNGKSLAAAMGDEAWKTVEKSCDFTPVEPPKDKPAGPGYTISGNLVKVVSKGGDSEVTSTYTITVDGKLSTISMLEGKAAGSGRNGAEDALRTVAELRVKMLLDAIRAGRVKKYGG